MVVPPLRHDHGSWRSRKVVSSLTTQTNESPPIERLTYELYVRSGMTISFVPLCTLTQHSEYRWSKLLPPCGRSTPWWLVYPLRPHTYGRPFVPPIYREQRFPDSGLSRRYDCFPLEMFIGKLKCVLRRHKAKHYHKITPNRDSG